MNFYRKLQSIFYRWLAKRRLIQRYLYLIEVDSLLEEYLKSRLLRGGSQEFLEKGRNDLVNKQKEMRENENFISFLREI